MLVWTISEMDELFEWNGPGSDEWFERFQGEVGQTKFVKTQLYLQKKFGLEIDHEQLVQF